MLNVFVKCSGHAPFLNLFNVTLKNLGMFKVNSFCHLHSFFALCFYPIVEFFLCSKNRGKINCQLGLLLLLLLLINTRLYVRLN